MEEESKIAPGEELVTPYEFIIGSDVTDIILMIIFTVSLILIISWVLNFIPSFMSSMLSKIKNKSIIYDTDYLKESNLHEMNIEQSTIGDSEIGTKESSLFGWFTNRKKVEK